MAILNLYKPVGISPLDLIEEYKKQHPECGDQKMTYAGRLDPMAEGVVLILSNEDRFLKDDFLKFDKTYRAEILFGVETDTYDVLGIPNVFTIAKATQEVIAEAKSSINNLIGTRLIKVPPYSSVIVNKKPMFEWARNNQLDRIAIPEREMTVKSAVTIESSSISPAELLNLIESKVKLAQGDFRQEEIVKAWNNVLRNSKNSFVKLKIDFHVTSGTYIRSLAHELGQQLGCGSILLGLTRTAVGEYNVENSTKL